MLNSQSVKHDVKSSSEQPLHFLALKTETEQKTFLLVIVDFGLLSFNGNILWSISHAELCCDHNFCLVNSKKVLKLLSTMGPSLHEHLNVDSGTNFNFVVSLFWKERQHDFKAVRQLVFTVAFFLDCTKSIK